MLLGLTLLAACGGGSSGSSAPGTSAYTIGGSVAGLTAASGVVLLNDGADALSVSVNSTSFTFSTALANGANYAVSVETQPSGETCSVASSTGMVQNANVTSVAVTCNPTTYSVGGTVSGLSASGLVLENSGVGDDIAAGASSFAFSGLGSGANYNVTVRTEPTGETCTVVNGQGTVSAANVVNITVTCSSVAYFVGGSISGLASESGLVLLNNGGNALNVAAGATTFSFSADVASGSAYGVTVQSQPTGETCTVANGSGTAGGNVTSVKVTCASAFAAGGSNVVQVTVGPGPANQNGQTFNIPHVSVTVCEPDTNTCGTISDVLVDTGSSGLRLMASALQDAGVTLTAMSDPQNPGNTIQECLPFADGYAWGAVATATVTVGGETSSGAIPIQVINDSSSPPAPPDPACTGYGSSLDSVNVIDANGVIGLSVLNQDCGGGCVTDAPAPNVYFSCTARGSCSSTTQQLAEQVANPAASFPTDNNGVILQLAAIPASGATSGSGYLVFGIGTESNNTLEGATVLTANEYGNFTTTFNSQSLGSSFLDSGSNALYFTDSSLPACGSSGGAADFYCPTTTASLSATNQGCEQGAATCVANGTTSTVFFQIANLIDISDTDFAIDDVGGTAGSISGFGPYFDWGLPFFYGRTVFDAIEGRSAAGTEGPYYAY